VRGGANRFIGFTSPIRLCREPMFRPTDKGICLKQLHQMYLIS
jgi:hypothetical protein